MFGSRDQAPYPRSVGEQMQIVRATYSPHVLKAPEENITRGRISRRFVIDSRDRDVERFPEPNYYRIPVPEEYRNVVSAQLVQAIIPGSPYNVNRNNNLFYFEETLGVCLTAEITPGNYCIGELLQALEDAMNDVGGSCYKVVLIPFSNLIRIESDLAGGDGIFRPLFHQPGRPSEQAERSLAPLLGMPVRDCSSSMGSIVRTDENIVYVNEVDFTRLLSVGDFVGLECNDELFQVMAIPDRATLILDRNVPQYSPCTPIWRASVTGLYPYDLCGMQYAILVIEELGKLKSAGQHIQDAFAVVPLRDCYNHLDNGSLPKQREITYFNPPLERLRWFTVRFLTHDGQPYDFAGRDHLLDLELYALNQSGKYNTLDES